ncbi:MAG: universal stress protein [Synechococcus sp.]|nr:universal stress protein [Synechococcus sp.]
MEKILLCTDGSDFAKVSYLYAAWFGDRLKAAIDILHVSDARGRAAAEARNFTGRIGLGTAETLLQELIDLEHQKAKLDHQRAKIILQEAQQILKEQGIDQLKALHETGFLLDCVQALAAQTDLIVLGKRGETANFAAPHLGANTERLIRSVRVPCVVTPKAFQPIERVLIAYDDSPSCRRLLEFLSTADGFHGLAFHLLTVAQERDQTAADPRLENAKRQLEAVPVSVTYHLGQGDPEKAIAEYIQTQNIHLLMMGAHGYRRIRQLLIGSTTLQVLRSSQIPVFVFR